MPVPFDRAGADRFGKVAAVLARGGSPIGPFDTAIAAHALSLNLRMFGVEISTPAAFIRRVEEVP